MSAISEDSNDEDPFTTLERTNWQRGFQAYDIGFGPLTRKVIPSLLDAVSFPPPSQAFASSSSNTHHDVKFLDVATGPGYVLSEALALERQQQANHKLKRQTKYTAFDISTNFLDLAKSNLEQQQEQRHNNHQNIEFVQGDASKPFPLDSNTFDCICCNFGILHLSNPDMFLKECKRILRPNGKVSFSAWAAPPATQGFHLILSAVQTAGNMGVPLPEGPPFFRFASKEEVVASMTRAGFESVSYKVLEDLEWDNIKSAKQLYDLFLEGTARTRELLRRQSPEESMAIQRELSKSWTEMTENGSRKLRMPVVLASGTKPRSPESCQ